MTRYELGLYGLIPMPMHLMLDAGTAILMIASPWLFGFADRIYWPHVMVGVFELVVGAMSRTQPQRGRPTHNGNRGSETQRPPMTDALLLRTQLDRSPPNIAA